jgi:protein-S-isoprenylcysteine O-methyltransferase Ste14
MVLLRWLSQFVWLIWLVVYWRGGVDLVAGITRAFRSRASHYGSVYLLGIVLLSSRMLVTGYPITTGRAEDPVPSWLFPLPVAGLAVIVAAAAGTLFCRYYLDRLWSASPVVRADHRVVDRGPYGLVRHPLCAFSCVMSLGTALVFLT